MTGMPSESAGHKPVSAQVKAELISVIPNLRAFAVSLCGNPDRADDLVQETLVKAWGNLDSFVEGTNLPAWLFTILRNFYYSEYRKRRREVPDPDGAMAIRLATAPAQNGHMDLCDLHDALQQLPNDQREALILIGVSGLAYEEAAEICGCAVGTMKSRVNRARNRLANLLSIHSTSEFGHSENWQATDPATAGHQLPKTGSD
ncbi:RNA polymerase sigma-70 factor (ECF subfamily) [Methylovirgula ligni]|uniref:RNA polymerase sigma factor n=2 Tax=Methylovirgula ligni TaxID=569860 RepID=A0A3D9Z550_9HYPH|nr:RNA polymerase sigma-70 factor (ECF subfamily) [Methylovirgula ligni]